MFFKKYITNSSVSGSGSKTKTEARWNENLLRRNEGHGRPDSPYLSQRGRRPQHGPADQACGTAGPAHGPALLIFLEQLKETSDF